MSFQGNDLKASVTTFPKIHSCWLIVVKSVVVFPTNSLYGFNFSKKGSIAFKTSNGESQQNYLFLRDRFDFEESGKRGKWISKNVYVGKDY